MTIAALLLVAALLPTPVTAVGACPAPSQPENWKTLSGETGTSVQAESFLLDLMKKSKITALSVAVVQDDRVVFDRTLGVVARKTRKPASTAILPSTSNPGLVH
jgi:CubicO group peptidase (beta-lactamase class C family)